MTDHRFDPTILREYDIRGLVGQTLSARDARAIGQAFGTLVCRAGGSRVAVGYDGRLSSPEMEAALVDGLVDAGVTALRIGLGPTPMLYFSVYHLEADGGIMVTGSHNPPDFNGFKMMMGRKPFYGSAIQDLGRQVAAGDLLSGQAGTAESHDVRRAYVARLLQDYDGARPLKVVWDAGNGAAGAVLADLVAGLPGQHDLLFADVDGRFPNHHPDPTVEKNLADLKARVKEIGADLGIAFDGDGDRVGVVDGQGRVLWGDQILALLGRDVLKDRPGATIIADVKASQVLFDDIAAHGGTPLMWKTGHSLIKVKMAETKSPLAGEMSGHIFFADKFYGFDDALYVGMRFVGIAARSDRSVAQMRDGLPQMVNTPELRFDCDEATKFGIVERVRENLAKAGATVDATDGVRVKNADGWWLLRASNTQPVLVARCEARDEAGLDRLKAELTAALTAVGVAPPAL